MSAVSIVRNLHQPRLVFIPTLAAYAARTLLWNGDIPYTKIGKRHLVEVRDAGAFIARLKEGAQ